jgi:hypothetical protein
MNVASLRALTGSLAFVLAAAGPLAAAEPTLEGTWVLDLKSSRNVPEAQKGVDLKIELRDEQMTIRRFVGEVGVGEPMVVTVDGKSRSQNLGKQRATVTAKWLVRDRKVEQVVSMPQPGSVFIAVQTVVSEVSASGGTMTRTYSTRLAKEREERFLVYRRK